MCRFCTAVEGNDPLHLMHVHGGNAHLQRGGQHVRAGDHLRALRLQRAQLALQLLYLVLCTCATRMLLSSRRCQLPIPGIPISSVHEHRPALPLHALLDLTETCACMRDGDGACAGSADLDGCALQKGHAPSVAVGSVAAPACCAPHAPL